MIILSNIGYSILIYYGENNIYSKYVNKKVIFKIRNNEFKFLVLNQCNLIYFVYNVYMCAAITNSVTNNTLEETDLKCIKQVAQLIIKKDKYDEQCKS